jgi:hypothetical protein
MITENIILYTQPGPWKITEFKKYNILVVADPGTEWFHLLTINKYIFYL